VAGNQSKPLEISVGKDTIAPDKAVAQLNAAGDLITGTAEANAKIQIKDSSGKLIASGVVDAQGKFTIAISTGLTVSKETKVYVIDASGNSSGAMDIDGAKILLLRQNP
jgi:hypothetical protein